MTTTSAAYADLGGGTSTAEVPAHRSRPVDRSPGWICPQHLFDPLSGWCGCGLRDDGQTAPGSPAWRASLDKTMPDTNKDPR